MFPWYALRRSKIVAAFKADLLRMNQGFMQCACFTEVVYYGGLANGLDQVVQVWALPRVIVLGQDTGLSQWLSLPRCIINGFWQIVSFLESNICICSLEMSWLRVLWSWSPFFARDLEKNFIPYLLLYHEMQGYQALYYKMADAVHGKRKC